MSEITTFDHVNLSEVDPNQATVTDGMYTFLVADAGIKTFTYKNGPNTGNEGQRISLRLAITDSEKFNGKSFFPSLFFGEGTLKQLRRIQDATGVNQSDMPLEDWLKELKTAGAKFKAPLRTGPRKQADGSQKDEQGVNLWEVQPS